MASEFQLKREKDESKSNNSIENIYIDYLIDKTKQIKRNDVMRHSLNISINLEKLKKKLNSSYNYSINSINTFNSEKSCY